MRNVIFRLQQQVTLGKPEKFFITYQCLPPKAAAKHECPLQCSICEAHSKWNYNVKLVADWLKVNVAEEGVLIVEEILFGNYDILHPFGRINPNWFFDPAKEFGEKGGPLRDMPTMDGWRRLSIRGKYTGKIPKGCAEGAKMDIVFEFSETVKGD